MRIWPIFEQIADSDRARRGSDLRIGFHRFGNDYLCKAANASAQSLSRPLQSPKASFRFSPFAIALPTLRNWIATEPSEVSRKRPLLAEGRPPRSVAAALPRA